MVNIPYVQRKVTQVATTELSEHLGVPVKIDRIGIKWLNRLALDGVYLEDQSGNPLLEVNHVSAGFELLPFMRGKFVFTTVRLFGFNLNLHKENPTDKLNLQFVIDAFASRDTIKKAPNIDLRLNTVLLRRGQISYHVSSEKQTPGRFNPKHIDINNVSGNISLRAFNKDSLNANIKRLSFDETTGFTLDKLSMNIVGNRDSAYIDHFEVKLPQSNLKIDKATMNISAVEGLTTLLNDAPMELSIAPSQISLKDLSSFIPAFNNFTDVLEVSAEASGSINNINLKHLTLSLDEQLMFNGRMELRGITNPEDTYVFGRIEQLNITNQGLSNLINNFSQYPVILPDPVTRLGTINFTGEISGFFDNLVAYGKFSSAIGSVQTDVLFGSNKEKNIATYVRGQVVSSVLSIDKLFAENNPYGNARFDISLDASRKIGGHFSGKIEGEIGEVEFKDYKYENILLSGNFQHNGFNGTIQINDPNGELSAEGMFQNDGQNSVFNFTAGLRNFRPDKLNLTNKYKEPEISVSLTADFTGNNIDIVEGSVRIDSLQFKTLPSDFFLKKMEITASGHSDDRRLTIASDILNGEVIGAYSFETIVPSFINTFEHYLPSLIRLTQKKEQVKENNFSILMTVENTEDLSQTLQLPFTIVNQARITGHYNNRYDKFRVEAWLPQFKIGKSMFESGHLSCENPADKVNLHLKATQYTEKGARNYFDLKSDAAEDQINAFIGWANNKEKLFKADLSASALFVEEKKDKGKPELRTEITLNESPVYVNDSLWYIEPSSITVHENKIDIDNFILAHAQQFLHLDGTISHEAQDTLRMNLQQIELSYIFDVLGIPVLQFGGEATGSFVINDVYDSRMLNTDLMVHNFSFNKTQLGLLSLYSEWDDTQQGILMLGSIYKNDSTFTDVNGYIFPVKPKEGLSLHFDANDIDISFLQPFLKNVASGLQGRGFGHVHLYGPFHELTVEGDTYVKDAGMGIDFLNTYYTFSDSIILDPTSINIKDARIFDKYGNSANADFTFNHKYFHDYDFDATFQANNMLLYDQSEKNSPLIYGTAFGSGTGTIKGNENVIDFDINVRSDAKTSVGFNFMTSSASTEYDFITFIDKSDSLAATQSTDTVIRPRIMTTESGAELRMNFLVDITPDATIEMIIDPNAGDRIKGNGRGSLQIQYGTKSDLRMYGGVSIVGGNYNFSLQQIIHKDFKLREGGTINFQGDPMNANLNIDAIYNLTAYIGDLDENLLNESGRSNVPVNCILTLEGMLQNPQISFDIELPGSNAEIERQVKSLIDTEDMMTRQIVYLLVLNKFYTPEYSSNEYRTGDFSAVASSAISTQLSNILNTITDKVQIGTNIRTSQDKISEDNTEVEMLLSSQLLDNRLIFNGNFGYRNSHALQKNVFVGEFDLEYKLTPSGEIRLKAYNHANDMYQSYKQSLTTQGVGIMFKKDFTNLSDLFRRKRREIIAIPPKKEEEIKEEVKEDK